MALENHLFFDPLDVLIGEENRTCQGCDFEEVAFQRPYCSKGKKHGNHCKLYHNSTEQGDGKR